MSHAPPAPVRLHPWREVVRLATRDFLHELRISLCYALALMAVLAPLMILFGLKFGLIDTLAQRLIESPANRELVAIGSHSFAPEWFERMRTREDVAFVVPNTRRIAATLARLSHPDSRQSLTALAMFPSGPGDPLLADTGHAPTGLHEIVLSGSAARRLQSGPGDTLNARVTRRLQGRDQAEEWPVQVIGVLTPERLPEEAVLVSLELLVATENYRDGVAVPALGWSGRPPPTGVRNYARFRLYARSIYDVAALARVLEEEGTEVHAPIAEIAAMQALDTNLGRVFWLIALITCAGFAASLAASLLASVERKRRELSLIRLLGLPTRALVLFPMTQAALVAVLGALAALLAYLPVSLVLNGWFSASLRPGESICQLLPLHYLIALVAPIVIAVLSAAWAGTRAARIEPAEGIRDL